MFTIFPSKSWLVQWNVGFLIFSFVCNHVFAAKNSRCIDFENEKNASKKRYNHKFVLVENFVPHESTSVCN